MDRIKFVHVMEHVEVYLDDLFLFSADTVKEAMEELKEDNDAMERFMACVMQPRTIVRRRIGQARVNAEPAIIIFSGSGSEMKSDRN